MRGTSTLTVLALATMIALGVTPAAAQEPPSASNQTERLAELGQQLKELVGHVEQMRDAVRKDPSLARRMSSLPELEAVVSTGRLLEAVTVQLQATARQVHSPPGAKEDSLGAPVRQRYRRLRSSLASVVDALAGTVARYDSLRLALHKEDGG